MLAFIETTVLSCPIGIACKVRYNEIAGILQRVRNYNPEMRILYVEEKCVAKLKQRHWISGVLIFGL